MAGPSQPGHLRDVPSYCLDEYEEEVPSTRSQVEDEESRDGLDPGQLQADSEVQQQHCKSSQTQHHGLQRKNMAINSGTSDLVIVKPWVQNA